MNALAGAVAFAVERAPGLCWIGVALVLANLVWLACFVRALLK